MELVRDFSPVLVRSTRLRVGHGKRLLGRSASRPPSLSASPYGGGSIEPEHHPTDTEGGDSAD